MTSDDSRIKIPIISYGLRQEETIVQIAAALDNINSVVTDIFQQIENNISKHKEYLSTLQKRSAIIESKVNKLAGKNVTTTLYSHHKFPVDGYHVDTLFEMNLKPLKKKIEVPIESKFQHIKYNKVPSKLQFFHVNSAVNRVKNHSASLEHGLGCLPPEISCVDSLFLFNTSQNIYEKYVMLDPLLASNDIQVPEESEKTDIAAAPTSIVNNEMYRNENYFTGFYTPAFEEVPSIDVPVDLPDLPGIADDLKFSAIVAPVISSKPQPTDNKSKSIDEITVADLPVISKPKKQALSSVETAVANSSTKTVPPSSIPPPPPLPPEIPLPVSAPPPPPPLPGDDQISAPEATVPKNKAPVGDVHATLMEAIRKAGGKEKAHLRQVDSSETLQPSSSSTNENEVMFIDDLYAALARRRKGISGQKDSDKNVSMMDRVSAMIPTASDNESDDNSVEDGGNDWED